MTLLRVGESECLLYVLVPVLPEATVCRIVKSLIITLLMLSCLTVKCEGLFL